MAIAVEDKPDGHNVLWQILASADFGVVETDGGRRTLEQPPKSDGDAQDSRLMRLAGMTLAEIENHAIKETLHACGGNRSKTARSLGVSEKTIYNKMKSYRIRETF